MTRSTARRTTALLATFALPIALLAVPGTALAGAPSNDAYANAEAVGALPATITGTTIDSTGQTGEKLDVCHFDVPVASVWYKLTPTFTGAIAVDTFGSQAAGTDPELSIYRGTSLASQVLLGCSKNHDLLTSDARATALVTAGQPIRIRVSASTPGPITLHVARITPATNDDLSTPTRIASLPANVTAGNLKATTKPGEKLAAACPELIGSRWYRFTPTSTRPVRADTWSATFDTLVSVFRTTSTGLKAVACSDDADNPDGPTGPQAAVTWVARKGVTYLLQVGGYRGQSGIIPLHLQTVARPANDDFASAEVIDPTVGLNTHLVGSTVNATPQTGEPAACEDGTTIDASVWYRWTAPTNVTMHLTDVESGAAVYTGSSLTNLTEQACTTNSSELQWSAVSGTTYRIRVFGTSGHTTTFDLLMIQE